MYYMGSVGIVLVVFSCVPGVHLPRTVAGADPGGGL